MRGICSEVTSEPFFGGAVQVVIGRDQLLQLSLDINELWNVILHKRNSRIRQILHETHFRRMQDEDRLPFPIGPSCRAANAMDIVTRLVGRIKLNNPVNSGYLNQDQDKHNRVLIKIWFNLRQAPEQQHQYI